MKPGDHPEFYRFPAPGGASRESDIVLDAEGRFYHEGAPIEHPGMHRAFASWIRRHPDDGRYILSNDFDWCYLTVEGTPSFVQGVRGASSGIELTLFDGRRELLDPTTLTLGDDGVLRARVRGGDYEARFLRQAQLELGPWLDADGEGGFVLVVGESRYPIPGGERLTPG